MLSLTQFTKLWQVTSLKLAILAMLVGLAACQQSQSPVTQTPSPSATTTTPSETDSTQTQLIDDLEDKDGGNAFGGGWFTYNDKANGGDSVVSPAPGKFTSSEGGANGSARAAKMTGKVTKTFPYSNIAMGTTLGKDPIDISKYKGIEFWAKGDGKKFQLQLQTPLIKDFNFYNYVFTAQPEWTRYEVLFDQIKQEDWGKKTVAVPKSDALTKINGIVWRTYPLGQPRENVELAIDDVKFIK